MPSKTFRLPEQTRTVVEFAIERPDGDPDLFHFTPGKQAAQFLDVIDAEDDDEGGKVAAAQGNWAWFRNGLPGDEYDRLVARLRDDDDPLDVDQIAEIISWLMGKAAKRPTGSRRG